MPKNSISGGAGSPNGVLCSLGLSLIPFFFAAGVGGGFEGGETFSTVGFHRVPTDADICHFLPDTKKKIGRNALKQCCGIPGWLILVLISWSNVQQ